MLNCVLDDGLQQHYRNTDTSHRRGYIEFNAQSFIESHGFEFQIVIDDLEFLRQRHQLVLTRIERVTERTGEPRDRVLSARWIIGYERTYRIQCIKQKVRVELRFQQSQLGQLQCSRELRLPELGQSLLTRPYREEIND